MDEKSLEARLIHALVLLAFAAALAGPAAAADKLTWREANKQSAKALEEKKLEPAARLAKQAFDLYGAVGDGYDAALHAQLLLNSMDAQWRIGDPEDALRELERGADMMTRRNNAVPPAVLLPVYEEGVNLSSNSRAAYARRVYRRAIELSDRVFGVNDARSILLMARWAAERPREHDASAQLIEARRRAVAASAPPSLLALLDLGAARLEATNGYWNLAIEGYDSLIRGLEARNDPNERTTLQTAYAQLAYAYDRTDNTQEAERVRRKLAQTFDANDVLKPLFRVEPAWPAFAEASEATIELEITVDGDGNVSDTRVLHATHIAFVRPTLQAISKWKFAPKIVDGKPVVQKGLQRIDYRMSR